MSDAKLSQKKHNKEIPTGNQNLIKSGPLKKHNEQHDPADLNPAKSRNITCIKTNAMIRLMTCWNKRKLLLIKAYLPDNIKCRLLLVKITFSGILIVFIRSTIKNYSRPFLQAAYALSCVKKSIWQDEAIFIPENSQEISTVIHISAKPVPKCYDGYQ